MIRCLAYAFNAIFKSRARLVAENLWVANYYIVKVYGDNQQFATHRSRDALWR